MKPVISNKPCRLKARFIFRLCGKIHPVRTMAFLTAAAVLLAGCGQKQGQSGQQQSAQGTMQAEKVPDQLKGLEESIESILQSLNGPAVVQKQECQKQGASAKGGQGDSGKKQEQTTEDKSKSQQGQGGQQKPEGQAKEYTQKLQAAEPWEGITGIMHTLHYQWNSYMSMAAAKGANKQLLDNFGTALNNLSNSVMAKNKLNTMLACSTMYSFIPDFFALYRTKTSPEIKRIRHYVRNSMLNSMTGNWNQADQDMNNLKSSWAICKSLVGKEQQEMASKLDFSIYEMEKVLKERNQALADIKGRVVLSNIESLEKEMEQSK